MEYVILQPAQLDGLCELKDHWAFLWDKRRSLWIAAEDCPDGEQFEEAGRRRFWSRRGWGDGCELGGSCRAWRSPR